MQPVITGTAPVNTLAWTPNTAKAVNDPSSVVLEQPLGTENPFVMSYNISENTELDLEDTGINRTIPTEIGLMTALSSLHGYVLVD